LFPIFGIKWRRDRGEGKRGGEEGQREVWPSCFYHVIDFKGKKGGREGRGRWSFICSSALIRLPETKGKEKELSSNLLPAIPPIF